MTRISVFRILVVSSAIFYLAWILLPYVPRDYTPPVKDLLSSSGYGASAWVMNPAFYFSVGAGKLLASIGLFLFRPWGRWLLLAVVVTSLASVPFAGISVGVPLDSIVGYFTSLTDGAVLALAFCSPIADVVRKDAEANPALQGTHE
jgi:hypothetical protein